MERILSNTQHANKILQLTADTMLLVSHEGICIDVNPHSDLWFLQEDFLLGKNVIDLLPEKTRQEIVPDFRHVIDNQVNFTRNYGLETSRGKFYFKCIMHPYEGMVLCQYRDITERSNVKLQLEVANRKLKEAQQAALIGQWSFNTNEDVLYFSGYTGILAREHRQGIIFDQYLHLVAAEDRDRVRHFLLTGGEDYPEQSLGYRVNIGKDMFYIRIKTFIRKVEKDGSLHTEGYIQNITDLQRQRNDLNTLTHAINYAKECVSAARKDGRMVFANNTFRHLHHIPEEADITQYKIYEVVGDLTSLSDWKKRIAPVEKTGSSEFIAHQPVRNKEHILAFRGILHRVAGYEDEPFYWSFAHDITEQLRKEAKIRQLNNLLDAIMQNLPAGIVVKDSGNDFKHIYQNPEAYNRISFATKQDAIGKNEFELHEQEYAQQIWQEDMEIVSTGMSYHRVFEDKDANGRRIVLDKRKMRIETEGFAPLILSIEWNITEQEDMKREIQVAKEKAEISDKLKSAFLANMSHEIRTPLNAIVGFSRVIMDCDDRAERESYYQVVEANNERLLQLINEILDLSKIESGIVQFTYSTMDLDELCNDVFQAHVFRCPPTVQLVYEPSEKSARTYSDKNRVFQVISNLIGNALKFTTEGSISFGYKQVGEQLLFHVRDTGAGIAPDKVNRVFERFVKGNTHVQGTGLGLSICKSIVERLGGEIWVTSELGKGSTFFFTLPVLRNEQDEEEETKNMPVQAPFNQHMQVRPAVCANGKQPENITILVAEDTDSNYELLEATIGKKFNLVRAIDGIEAVTLFESIKPDLILMDIKMPNLDGLETTKIIRQLSTDIPIVAQSAYAFEQDQREAQEAGCDAFIAKPIMIDELNEVLGRWLPM